MTRAAIVSREISPAELINEVKSNERGAISVFLGTVRDINDGRPVTGIDYSAYASMAESELAAIVAEAQDKFGDTALVVEHRVGVLELGDISVAIAAGHRHRASALDCTRFVIEEIKKRVPIWKLEHYVDGTCEWVNPTRARGATSR